MCRAELTFVDVDTGETITLGDTENLAVTESNITFDSQQLTSNRRYRVVVSASNIGGQATSGDLMISKLILLYNNHLP